MCDTVVDCAAKGLLLHGNLSFRACSNYPFLTIGNRSFRAPGNRFVFIEARSYWY